MRTCTKKHEDGYENAKGYWICRECRRERQDIKRRADGVPERQRAQLGECCAGKQCPQHRGTRDVFKAQLRRHSYRRAYRDVVGDLVATLADRGIPVSAIVLVNMEDTGDPVTGDDLLIRRARLWQEPK